MGTRSTIEEPDCLKKQSILVAMKTLIVGKEPVTVPSLLGTYYINLKSSELVKKRLHKTIKTTKTLQAESSACVMSKILDVSNPDVKTQWGQGLVT